MGSNRILIVEDEPDVLRLEIRILKSAGYEVDGVGCGEDALEMLRHHEYTVVVADVMMPGMDGFELAKKIREQFSKRLPVLLVTAMPDPLNEAHKRDAKPVAAIEKPFLSKSLVAMVGMLEEQVESTKKIMLEKRKTPEKKSWLASLFE